MKLKVWCLGFLICLGTAGAWATPPRSAPQQKMTVVVVNAHFQPAHPVESIRVSLTYLDNAKLITTSQDVTNRSGQVLLQVSPDAAQSGDLRIEITGASDLLVYQPADGQLAGLPAKVTISLLPKGSPLLLQEPAQIETMLYRYSQQVKKLEASLSKAQQRQKPDFSQSLHEWANTHGFSYEEVDQAVRQWADGIQRHKDQATLRQQILAEFAKRNYDAVIQLTGEAIKAGEQELDEEQAAYLEKRRKTLLDVLSLADMQANSYQFKLQYHRATQALESARDRAEAEHRRYPEDKALRSIWLEARWRTAYTREREGEVGPSSDSFSLLARSVEDYRNLLRECASPEERYCWATMQDNLATALEDQAERNSGERATELLAQAVQAYRAALKVRTRAELPQAWATTQDNLGTALEDQGEWSSGEQAAELFAQAVQAYRAVLEVRTKADLPQDWAKTQDNLGTALEDQGERSSGERATELLAQAVQAYRAALEVRTKADLPQDWATTQDNLGTALSDQGERSSGKRATELFAQAVQAYRAALEVRTKADLPQDWAWTQKSLGYALYLQNDYSAAVNAFEASLEIFPNDIQLLQSAAFVYYTKLFRYDRAYELTERWIKLDPSPVARLSMAVEDLTATRFEECVQQASRIEDAAFQAPVLTSVLIRDATKLACQWGAGQKSAARQTENTLVSKAPGLQKGAWEFAGTCHFLASAPAFETGRASWIALFESLESGDGAAMAGALHQLEEVMKR
jgi:tetratricopeptide (TPR) repeat protein